MFVVADYFVLILMLCTSAFIGLYFGCFGSKQKTATEYLYGKGSLKAVPIGFSIFSSAVSAVTIAGAPSEIYTFGSQFFMNYVGVLLSIFLSWYFILPVFCGKLKIATPYEYFELRFNYKIRIMSTIMYIIHTIIYMPIVLYASTINLSEIIQIPLPICTTLIGGVCIFYTMLGGFSAVIWSDTLQAICMLGSCIFVMIKGIIDIGGVSEIYHRAEQGGRIKFFTMDPNPFLRLTIWSAILGMCFNHGAHSGFGASSIQRYIALKNEKQARISTAMSGIATSIIGVVVCMIGLNMFAQYYNCDPVKNKVFLKPIIVRELVDIFGKEASSYNKLLSFYVATTVKEIPGFLGFFNAGILSAGLSTLSAELNTISGLIYHCIIKRIYRKPISEFNGAIIMKIIVLINGIYYLSAAPYMDRSKHLAAFALGIASITYGPKMGMMVLGTTFPKCNSIGVAAGAIIGMIIIGWINIGALYYDVNSQYVLPFSLENCTKNNFTEIFSTSSSTPILNSQKEEPFYLYKLSYMYYVLFGTIITISFALIVSYITGNNNENEIDPHLLIPSARPSIENEPYEETICMINLKNKE